MGEAEKKDTVGECSVPAPYRCGVVYDEPDRHGETAKSGGPPPPPGPLASTLPPDPPPTLMTPVGTGGSNQLSPTASPPYTGTLPDWVLNVYKTWRGPLTVAYPSAAKDPADPKKSFTITRTIQLYGFCFRGIDASKTTERVGVNRVLLLKLLKAQEELYRLYRGQRAAPKNDKSDQQAFQWFCEASESWPQQGRGGNHRDGSALDLDAGRSPWVPIMRPGGELSGESYHSGDNNAWNKVHVWEPCIEIYHRAYLFLLGRRANPCKVAGNPSKSYDVFKELHDTLRKYFGYRYPKGGNGPPFKATGLPETSEDEFIARVKKEAGSALKAGKLYLDKKETPLSDATDDDLKKAFAQIAEDRAQMRYGMVSADMQFVGGEINPDAVNYRDPCNGVLGLKKEVVVALCNTGLRWLGQDLGDMMHFDTMSNSLGPNYESVGFGWGAILNEFLDVPIAWEAGEIIKKIGDSSDPAAMKVKQAATALKNAADTAGPAANAASLAEETTKEDACWAAVRDAYRVLVGELKAANASVQEYVKDPEPKDEKKLAAYNAKKEKALKLAGPALTAALEVEAKAKAAAEM
jgi:hypothetical protein